jgi:hypothetical protein
VLKGNSRKAHRAVAGVIGHPMMAGFGGLHRRIAGSLLNDCFPRKVTCGRTSAGTHRMRNQALPEGVRVEVQPAATNGAMLQSLRRWSPPEPPTRRPMTPEGGETSSSRRCTVRRLPWARSRRTSRLSSWWWRSRSRSSGSGSSCSVSSERSVRPGWDVLPARSRAGQTGGRCFGGAERVQALRMSVSIAARGHGERGEVRGRGASDE